MKCRFQATQRLQWNTRTLAKWLPSSYHWNLLMEIWDLSGSWFQLLGIPFIDMCNLFGSIWARSKSWRCRIPDFHRWTPKGHVQGPFPGDLMIGGMRNKHSGLAIRHWGDTTISTMPSFRPDDRWHPKIAIFVMGKTTKKKPVELIPSRSIWAVETAMNRMAWWPDGIY